MVSTQWRFALVGLLCCGGTEPTTSTDAGMITEEDSDILAFGDRTIGDAPNFLYDAAFPDVSLVDGGGPFLCGPGRGCICDGQTHWCNISATGPPGDPPPAPMDWDADVCGDASTCLPLPSACLGAPTCACLMASIALCYCEHSDSGDGLVAGCFNP